MNKLISKIKALLEFNHVTFEEFVVGYQASNTPLAEEVEEEPETDIEEEPETDIEELTDQRLEEKSQNNSHTKSKKNK